MLLWKASTEKTFTFGHCPNYLITNSNPKVFKDLLSSQIPSEHPFLSNLWGRRPLASPSLYIDKLIGASFLWKIHSKCCWLQNCKWTPKSKGQMYPRPNCAFHNWDNQPWTQPSETSLASSQHDEEISRLVMRLRMDFQLICVDFQLNCLE